MTLCGMLFEITNIAATMRASLKKVVGLFCTVSLESWVLNVSLRGVLQTCILIIQQ